MLVHQWMNSFTHCDSMNRVPASSQSLWEFTPFHKGSVDSLKSKVMKSSDSSLHRPKWLQLVMLTNWSVVSVNLDGIQHEEYSGSPTERTQPENDMIVSKYFI